MARDNLTTDDFLLDQLDRNQQHLSRGRREGRLRQRRVYLLTSIVFVLLVVLAAPSFVSHSPIGRSIVSSIAAQQGLAVELDSVRVGWVTPLRLGGIQIKSFSDSNHFHIDQVDCDVTVLDLIGGIGSEFGEIVVRGVDVHCSVDSGICSLERDLEKLFVSGESQEDGPSGNVSVQDMKVLVRDAPTGNTWQLSQSSAEIVLQPTLVDINFVGVLGEPSGNAGSVQGRFSQAENAAEQWQLQIKSETLPLSVASLVQRRFSNSVSPLNVSGSTTGEIQLTGLNDGSIHAVLDRLNLRHLQASDAETGDRVWSNQDARINGDLMLTIDRVVGRKLQASTDFATATLDGSFSRSITLTGVNDNPLRWLDAIDGAASIKVDLAAMDEALPGVIPLRENTRIVSGLATASVNSAPDGAQRRSQLSLHTDPFRASTDGRIVVIEPIELTAAVVRANGLLNAERFQWDSSFASVLGHGDLRSGSANVEIDFGRLASMLKPIVKFSDTQLDGLARGDIRWNATGENLWQLTGSGNASNVQIKLPGGQMIRQANLRGDIDAEGRWGNERLDELTQATVKLVSSGLDVRAELTRPVRDPTLQTGIPIRIESKGRLDSFAEAISPWLPAELHDVDGQFEARFRGEASLAETRVTNAAIELMRPRIAYGTKTFTQPNIKVHFDGSLGWPSGDLEAKSMTFVGDALSASVRGQLNAEHRDLEIAWRAKLERVQGSVRTRVAGGAVSSSGPTAQQVAYRSGNSQKADDWIIRGDFDGKLIAKQRGNVVEVESHTTGKDVAVVQPPQASAESQMVGPMPRQHTSRAGITPINGQESRVVWAEPNLKIDGVVRYDRSSGQLDADGLQIATDWFATTLAGGALMDSAFRSARFNGPARIKMDEVAARLTQLAGTTIQVEGIQETPLTIDLLRGEDGTFAFTVDGNLGWESGEVAGVEFGPSSVPVRLTETSVSVAPSVIPVGQGQLNLAGDVYYRPGPIWMRLQPGTVARSIRLTPEMTERWLKYLAPMAAATARIDGTISAEIDEAMIVLDDPRASRTRGRLNVDGIQMTAGPMAQQLISGVDQLKALTQVLPGQSAARDSETYATKLITLPPQSVEFLVDQGVVSHKKIFFEIDRASLLTSGQVGLDGRLSLVAQIPLDARWLGSDLQGLAGQAVSLPITGTLSSPRLDSSGVRQVVAQLTTQTIQSVGDTFLKKQIERSEDYLGEQIGRGLDKLFGR